MKKMLTAVGTVMALVLSVQNVQAQGGTSAVPFLLISPNSRASGMGESGTGIADDATAITWNPAGLAFQKGNEVSITHANWLPQFHLSDLFYDYLNFRTDLPEYGGTLGASVTYLNLGEFIRTDETGPEEKGRFKAFEVAATVGYATKLYDDLGLGLNLRFINSSLSPIGTAQEKGNGIAYDLSFDVAMLYKPKHVIIPFTDEDLGEFMSVGFNLTNLGPKITYIDAAQADPLPTTFRLGLGIYPVKDEHNSISIALDFSKLLVYRNADGTSDPLPKSIFTSLTKPSLNNLIKSVDVGGGIEYWYDKLIALRWGYFYEDPNYGNRNFMTFGAGIRYDIYGFDFSYISSKDENSPLSDTLRFTLLILWGAL